MAALHLVLLGGFAARTLAGEPVVLATRKAQVLLAYLALTPGRAHARASLQGLLWGDRAEEQARGSLRYALTDIRRGLASQRDLLCAEGDRVRLRAEVVSVDALELERRIRSGGPAALREAAALYRGELLAGNEVHAPAFEEWLTVERERLRGLAIEALGTLLDGDPDPDLAQRLLALDPVNEIAHRALMRHHAGRGQWTLALRQYETCCGVLKRELDTAPEPATRRLRADILSRRLQPDEGAPPPQRAEPPAADRPGVRVLPFGAVGDPAGLGALASELGEGVATELARFREVIVFQSAGGDAARFQLEGTIQAVGPRLRVAVRLVEVGSGRHIWAERYDRAADDPLAVADELTGMIAVTVAARLAMLVQEEARRKPPQNLRAYECFVQGNRVVDRVDDPDAQAEARRWFEQALKVDPTFARAHSGLAFTYAMRTYGSAIGRSLTEGLDHALRHAEAALDLDPLDARVHYTLASVCLQRRAFERARRHFARAVELNPNDPTVMVVWGYAQACLGEAAAGLATVDRALHLNHSPPEWYFSYRARTLLLARRPAESAVQLRGLSRVDGPRNWGWLTAACAHAGWDEDAGRHADAFLDAVRAAWQGDATAGPPEFGAWFLDVCPLARKEDREYLRLGLRRAGLPV